MNPGKLDRRIVLQVRVVSKDATGSRVETWADSATVWAEFVKQSGKESDLSDAERSQDFQQFRIRYRGTLNATDYRILYRSKFYDITGLTEEGRTEFLLLDTVATQSVS
jgi:SPP1 family predicted phage head-tail adaptor